MSSAQQRGEGDGGVVPATLTFVGTATTLLRLGPFTDLTDPNFLRKGQLAYLGKGLVSRRRTSPAPRRRKKSFSSGQVWLCTTRKKQAFSSGWS